MKIKFFAILSVVALTVASCKDESKKVDKGTIATEESVKQNFNVEINAMVSAKDDFAVYFTEDGTNNFTANQAVWSGIAATGNIEKVNFELSEEIIPTLIRLDFGMNKQQGDVVIKNIRMSHNGKDFSFQGSDFFKYFIKTDEFKTEVNPADGTLIIVKGDGDYKTPYFYPTQLLIDEIAKITSFNK